MNPTPGMSRRQFAATLIAAGAGSALASKLLAQGSGTPKAQVWKAADPAKFDRFAASLPSITVNSGSCLRWS